MEDVPFRKQMRLKGCDYSQTGYYYVTICTINRSEILGQIVGGDAHIAPSILLTEYGKITKKYIENINISYAAVYVEKYVIMPNHIHMITALANGAMWASPPTGIKIPRIVRSLKTLVTKECGNSLFQESYFDHIIRDETDYLTKWNYIDTNIARWADDKYNSV
jgi:REP element-mobilizing transposase RayT